MKFATDVTQKKLRSLADASKIAAVNRAQAMIEFKLDGTIITANENFLTTMGYSLAEIQGRHHSMFVEPAERDSAAYRDFWAASTAVNIGRGIQADRQGRQGGLDSGDLQSILIDEAGKPFSVVKFATDVTEQKLISADLPGQIDAIGKSQAVIEFNMDGTIITANDNFLNALGYSLDRDQRQASQHVCRPAEHDRAAIPRFLGELQPRPISGGRIQALGKGGREVWIQASYNPILDLNGKPFKVVKYATDITAQVLARMGASAFAE